MSFKKNGDGTVTDTVTGLMWQEQDDSEERSYLDALAYCTDLGLGGQEDWRLPNVVELQTLFQQSSSGNHEEAFVNARAERYWSIDEFFSTREPNRRFAYTYDFQNAHATTYYQEYKYYVRAVRG